MAENLRAARSYEEAVRSSAPAPPHSKPLRELLSAVDGALADAGAQVCASWLLEELREELERHFREEELGGYLAQLRRAAPWLGPRLDAVLLEHAKFRAWLGELLGEAGRGSRDPGRHGALARAFAEFRAALQAHEREEDRLSQEAFPGDMGGC